MKIKNVAFLIIRRLKALGKMMRALEGADTLRDVASRNEVLVPVTIRMREKGGYGSEGLRRYKTY